jgi:hypothetical protein
MLKKCFGCLTGCCPPSWCRKQHSDESLEIAGDDEEDVMSCRQPFSASSPPGWRHQGTLSKAFDSDISGISTVPLSQSVPPITHKSITAAVSPFPGPAAYSTRSPAANQRPLSCETAVLPTASRGGMMRQLPRQSLKYAAAPLPNHFGNANSRPFYYIINQQGHLLPHDSDLATIEFGHGDAVRYQAAQDHEAGGDYEDPGSNPGASRVEAQEPPRTPPPSRAASLVALNPATMGAAGIGAKP